MREYLIYTSAGSTANVKQWFSSAKRDYDIWLTNYTDTPMLNKEYSDYYNEHKGSKFQNLSIVYQEHRDILSNHKAIMVLDDDIIVSPSSLSALFNTLISLDLWLLQPAFSRFGGISHNITKRQLSSSLRYTNFVEVGCPLFRTDKLLDFLSVYKPDISLCFGLDYWFPYHFGMEHHNKYAISDKYYCINPRGWWKPGGRREIDLLVSTQERILMGNRVRHIIGIGDFKYREYQKIQKSILESISSVPLYILEVLFAGFISVLSNMRKIYRMIKPNRDILY